MKKIFILTLLWASVSCNSVKITDAPAQKIDPNALDGTWIQSPNPEIKGLFAERLATQSENLATEETDFTRSNEKFVYFKKGQKVWFVELPVERSFFKTSHPLMFNAQGTRLVLVDHESDMMDLKLRVFNEAGQRVFEKKLDLMKILEARLSPSGDHLLVVGVENKKKPTYVKVLGINLTTKKEKWDQVDIGAQDLKIEDYKENKFKIHVSKDKFILTP